MAAISYATGNYSVERTAFFPPFEECGHYAQRAVMIL